MTDDAGGWNVIHMPLIERSALVAQPPARMFALVDDVAAYPRHFTWCEQGEVLSLEGDIQTARLHVKLGALKTSFTTRNTREEPSVISMQLAEGPFRRLSGQWHFDALGESGCKVSLRLEFETESRLFGSVLAKGFHLIADRMVDDFVRAAKLG